MSEATRRLWLVERTFGDEDLVTLVYATPDGAYTHTRQMATSQLFHKPTTAAIEVAEADLTPVEEEGERDRYAREVDRMREQNEPNEEV